MSTPPQFAMASRFTIGWIAVTLCGMFFFDVPLKTILMAMGFCGLALEAIRITIIEVAKYIEERIEAKLEQRLAQVENGTFRHIVCESIVIKNHEAESEDHSVKIHPTSVFLYDDEYVPSAGFGKHGGLFRNVHCNTVCVADNPNNDETTKLQLTPEGILGYENSFLKKLSTPPYGRSSRRQIDYFPMLKNIRLDEHHLCEWLVSQLESEDSELRQWLASQLNTEITLRDAELINLVVDNFQPKEANDKSLYHFHNYYKKVNYERQTRPTKRI